MGSKFFNLDLEDWDLEEESEDSLEGKYLVFGLDDRDYGISVHYVTEIIGLQKITEIPDTPDYIRGVITFRDRVIPVLDVRKRFRMEDKPDGNRTCLVLLQIRNAPLALLVESVREVITIPAEKIEEAPGFGEDPAERFIRSLAKIGDRVKILLDVEKLFREDEIKRIQSLSKLDS